MSIPQLSPVYISGGGGGGNSTGVYTWDGKPPINSVPANTIITISDLNYSDWRSDGTYWRPKDGRCAICVADLSAYSTTSTTLAALTISTADLPVLPLNDLMKIPKGRFIAYLTAIRTSAVSGMPQIFAQWAAANNATFCRTSVSSNTINGQLTASGDTEYLDGSQFRGAPWGILSGYNGAQGGPAYAAIPSTPVQPIISANVGGAGETLTLRQFQLEFIA